MAKQEELPPTCKLDMGRGHPLSRCVLVRVDGLPLVLAAPWAEAYFQAFWLLPTQPKEMQALSGCKPLSAALNTWNKNNKSEDTKQHLLELIDAGAKRAWVLQAPTSAAAAKPVTTVATAD
jgi:hypothetical protein